MLSDDVLEYIKSAIHSSAEYGTLCSEHLIHSHLDQKTGNLIIDLTDAAKWQEWVAPNPRPPEDAVFEIYIRRVK